MGPSALCDTLIWLLRIPAILLAVLAAWPLVVAASRLASRAAASPDLPLVFLGVVVACTALGIRLGRHRRGFGHLGTLEHEAAHAIVALATFHPITGGSVRRDSGHVTYATVTGGNWLIGIAPYVLPLVPLAAVIGVTAAQLDATVAGALIVGTATSWHLLATLSETRAFQPDLQRLGRLTWMPVVTAANVLEILLLIGWVLAGPTGARAVLTDIGTVLAEVVTAARAIAA
jgi:hypothetical protein